MCLCVNFAVPVGGGQAPGREKNSSPAWNLFRQRTNAGREPDIHFPRSCKGFEIGLAAECTDGGTELCEMKSAMSFARSMERFKK